MSLRGAALGALLVYTLPTAVALASAAKTASSKKGAVWVNSLRALGAYGVISSVAGTAVLLRSW